MPDDEELEKLKEEKMEEMQEEDSSGDREDQREKQRQQLWDQAKSYMTSEAVSRLGNIKAVDEEKALAIARQVKRLGESGRVEKVDDDQMKDILRSINSKGSGSGSDIKFRR